MESGAQPGAELRRGPLSGTRVVDLTRAVAGPFAGRLLADLGADVIKIESPGGDFARDLTPVGTSGFSAMFNHANAGKRSVVVDLRDERGLEIVRSLVQTCDVVLENFTPGVMSRMTLGYDQLRELNPGVILCSVSSFGQYGSYSGLVGADPVGQAMSGMVAMTGEPDAAPYPATNGIADTSTGSQAALAVLAALLDRARTGAGCHLDISMCDVMLFLDCCNVPYAAATEGTVPLVRSGRHNLTVSPFGVFPARDGYLLIEAWGEGPDSLWGRLCGLMERPELVTDPDFASNAARIRNRPRVTEAIEAWLADRGRDEAAAALQAARVVAAPVLSPWEATQHPVAQERQMLGRVSVGSETYSVISNPHRGTPWPVETRPGPLHGQHTREVLTEVLDLADENVSRLLGQGVVQQAAPP